mmetsp:Transcript_4647/g.7467  ORF Transcript_4647/g.7467 Transcript_4647/m.7467 type:complete len:95 (+) Transcript_4647:548-832(+)
MERRQSFGSHSSVPVQGNFARSGPESQTSKPTRGRSGHFENEVFFDCPVKLAVPSSTELTLLWLVQAVSSHSNPFKCPRGFLKTKTRCSDEFCA